MLSLYVHIPFCVSKCHYCGFYSTLYENKRADQFLADLQTELKRRADLVQHRTFRSIYIGGGTPTTLFPDQLTVLFASLRDRIRIDPGAEVTIEANPNTLTADKLSHLKKQGVTRLSLGVQSFSDEILALLGRTHSARQARGAMSEARQAGFENIGIDLIFGIPGQTAQQWRKSLETAVSLRPEHISAYSLSVDDGSPLAREVAAGKDGLPDDDAVADMYATARTLLRDAGYHQYEISNFALTGRQCRHNVNYWDRGEYLGLGPGAWSFLGKRRFANVADVTEYSQRLRSGSATVDREEVTDRLQAAREALFLGLRKTIGIDLERYGDLAGPRSRELLHGRIRELEGAGLFRLENGTLSLTEKGMLLSNEALARLIP